MSWFLNILIKNLSQLLCWYHILVAWYRFSWSGSSRMWDITIILSVVLSRWLITVLEIKFAHTGCPTKHDSSSLTLNLCVTFSRKPSITCMVHESKTTNSPSPGISKMWSAFFSSVNITWDIKNFVQITILLN